MDLKTLWQYMQVDMEADRFQTKMRQSENRKKYFRQRKLIQDQQESMKKLQQELAVMSDREDAIADERERLERNLAALEESFEKDPPKTAAEVEERIAAVQHLIETLTGYENELQAIRRDNDVREKQQRDIRRDAAKALAEFNAIKQVYDAEFQKDEVVRRKLIKAAEAESAKVPPELLERYNAIKQHSTPPMAKLVGDQCSGCFMSLPGATLLEVRSGERIVECDNCGRILYVE